MNAASPCLNICRLDSRGICAGCFRTLDEIARWSRMSENEKIDVLAELNSRRPEAGTVRDATTE